MLNLLIRLLSIVLGTALIISIITPVSAQQDFATGLSEEKVKLITQNCVTAQVGMQRLERSDIVTRTNHGRSYETILNLMTALNSRLVQAKLNQPAMIEQTSQLQQTFTAFASHYTAYELSIEKATNINCRDQPVTFYEFVSTARDQRLQLKNDISTMQQLTEQYQIQYRLLQQTFILPPTPITPAEGGQ